MLDVQTRRDPKTVQMLLKKSRIESDTLAERDLRCPVCNFKIERVFSDAVGHLRVKCPKCKGNFVLNLAYFRKMKVQKNPPKIR